MTTYTTTELATRVLKDLGLIASEETPSAADLAWSIETCQTEIALLAAKGIPIWNGSDLTVPLEYLGTLSRRIGIAAAPSFGLGSLAEAQVAMRAAEDDLRIIGQTGPTYTTQEAEYF